MRVLGIRFAFGASRREGLRLLSGIKEVDFGTVTVKCSSRPLSCLRSSRALQGAANPDVFCEQLL